MLAAGPSPRLYGLAVSYLVVRRDSCSVWAPFRTFSEGSILPCSSAPAAWFMSACQRAALSFGCSQATEGRCSGFTFGETRATREGIGGAHAVVSGGEAGLDPPEHLSESQTTHGPTAAASSPRRPLAFRGQKGGM
jgi:hypothetical protein